VVATYQSVSGAGKDAMDELFSQTKAVYTNSELINKKFPSVSPSTSSRRSTSSWRDGYTKEEWKMMMETKKILDPKIRLTATCVRVPCSSAIPKPSTSSSRIRSRPTKRATSCAMRRAAS
jgi:aspartate-semialdehyde dehydrogenase